MTHALSFMKSATCKKSMSCATTHFYIKAADSLEILGVHKQETEIATTDIQHLI